MEAEMTCIVGLVDRGDVYIGADSAGVAEYDLMIRADEKVFRKGEFVFGFTSSFRMGQLLRYKFEPPDHPQRMSIYEYMVARFIDAVRECLKTGGYQKIKDNVDTGGFFLVGYRGCLFRVESDYQVGRTKIPFDAVGCGAPYALGALFASSAYSGPRTRILKAIKAAESFCTAVRGPFKILKCSAPSASSAANTK